MNDICGAALDAARVNAVWDAPNAASNPLRFLEWYLDGRSTAGLSSAGANVDAVSTEYTGRDVVIGLVDEGFDLSNPDLAGRFDLARSYDPRDQAGSSSVAPDSVAAMHGTWVAGVVGAAADNGYGIVGVASGATLAGFYMRFGTGGSSRSEVADLLAHQVNVDVSNNSWGYSTAFSDNFQDAGWIAIGDALQLGISSGRDGLGTVYVFAAGNDRQYIAGSAWDGDNTNSHNLTNSRFAITVAGSTQDGHIASFSTPGASILITAPAESILTVSPDNGDGDKTNDFRFVSGTSLAAPIVSGVVAMMLEANPSLGYRDVQEILALSAHQIDPASTSWSTNGATNWNGGGHLVSHDFGFGLVDAHAAVRLAETWSGVRNGANEASFQVSGALASTGQVGFSPAGYAASVSAQHQNFSIEWVELDLSLDRMRLGDLRIHLVSPDGTDSILLDHPAGGTDTTDHLSFTFSTDHAWGETAAGTWKLYVEDSGGTGGSVESWALRFYGDEQTADATYYYTNDFGTLTGNRSTLTDLSGNDTINAAAVTADLALDLNPGANSTIAGRSVLIGAATIIENAFGGDGNDTITGNAVDNRLYGARGDDTLYGGAGTDQLHGGSGNDTLFGGGGRDQFWIDRPSDGIDRLADFVAGDDRIVLDHAGFGVAAGSLADAGVIFTTRAPTSSAPTIIYDPQSGEIAWDPDGAGAAAKIAIGNIDPTGSSVSQIGSTSLIGHPGDWEIAASGDANKDGIDDLIWYDRATGNTDIWKIAGGEWAASTNPGAHPDAWQLAGSGDFNADGAGDLAWFNATTGNLDVWQLVDGQWAASVNIGNHPIGWSPVGFGDFNADGVSDVAWYNATTGNIDIWTLQDGHWAGSSDPGSHPDGWQTAGVGDFNGDGSSDIVWFNPATGQVDIWLIVNGGWAASVDPSSHPGGWQIAGIGDFNADGTSDLLWNDPAGSRAEIWQLHDARRAASVDLGSHPGDWDVAAVGDFDGNGVSDVMWRDASGHMTNWLFDTSRQLSANDFLFG